MTDPLEKYRVMVRSIKFSPSSLGKNQSAPQVDHDSVPTPSSSSLSWAKISSVLDSGPPVDPSEHIADLVRNAVSKHTVLPGSYAIRDNIGDRISQLSPTREVRPTIILPPIPEPDPNWKPSTPVITPVSEEVISAQKEEITPVLEEIILEQKEEVNPVLEEVISEQKEEVNPVLEEIISEQKEEDTPVLEEIISEQKEEDTPVLEEIISEQKEEAIAISTEDEIEILEAIVEKHSPILEIICPKCGSHNARKNGRYKDKQRYACKDCGKQFALESQGIITEIKPAKTATKDSKTKGGFSGKSSSRSSKNKKKGKR